MSMQEFEYHPDLTQHIQRMGTSGKVGTPEEWNSFLTALNNALKHHIEAMYYDQEQQKAKECPSCYGSGRWETECCNGMGGCSCQGGLIDMGYCHVCEGTGHVIEGKYNPRANSDFILNAGACFAGSGPKSGYWASKTSLGYPKK